MQVRITDERGTRSSKLTTWYISSTEQGCYGGPGCSDCPLKPAVKEIGFHCFLFHTLSKEQLKAFLSNLLEKYRGQTVELFDLLNDYPEMLL